jgi:hypothetical protein
MPVVLDPTLFTKCCINIYQLFKAYWLRDAPTCSNIQQLYALPTLYLCVLYLSENKQRLVPLTA